jgi:hypothetical protein
MTLKTAGLKFKDDCEVGTACDTTADSTGHGRLFELYNKGLRCGGKYFGKQNAV